MPRFISHPELVTAAVVGDIDSVANDLNLYLTTYPAGSAADTYIPNEIHTLQSYGVANEDINMIIDASPRAAEFHLPTPTPGLVATETTVVQQPIDANPIHVNPMPVSTLPQPATDGITGLPLVGPIIGSLSASTGFSPTIVALIGVGLGLWLFGGLGGGGGSKSSKIW